MRFDFYLPEYDILIEYDGIQHVKPFDIWGGEEGLKLRQYRDKLKTQYAIQKDIPLIRINHTIRLGKIGEFLNNILHEYNIL